MKERIEKIKDHINQNRTKYAVAGGVVVGVIVGGTAVYFVRKGVVDSSVAVKQGIALNSPVTINNTTMVELVRRGHPGFKIQCIETGETFASIRRAAKMMNVDPSNLSKHLDGKTPHVGGYTFANLGEMT